MASVGAPSAQEPADEDAGKARAFWDESSVSVPAGWQPFVPNVSEAYET